MKVSEKSILVMPPFDESHAIVRQAWVDVHGDEQHAIAADRRWVADGGPDAWMAGIAFLAEVFTRELKATGLHAGVKETNWFSSSLWEGERLCIVPHLFSKEEASIGASAAYWRYRDAHKKDGNGDRHVLPDALLKSGEIVPIMWEQLDLAQLFFEASCSWLAEAGDRREAMKPILESMDRMYR